MAIKDQCTKCCYHSGTTCRIRMASPVYDTTSCEYYKNCSIDLDKSGHISNINNVATEIPEPPPLPNVVNGGTDSVADNKEFRMNMFQSPFGFEGRIRRLEYTLSLIIYYAYIFFLAFILGMMGIYSEGVFYLLVIPGYWFIIAQGAKRCHDRGNSGWFQIIPFYMLWMLFADGDEFENDYGHDPKGRNIFA